MMNWLIALLTVSVFYVSLAKSDSRVSEPQLLYKTMSYSVYCIEGYKWLVWGIGTQPPQQMFRESLNGISVPVECNR